VAKYSTADRQRLASEGKALPDGSYPIADRADLDNAIHAVGRGGTSHEKIRNHIRKRARDLGATAMLPDTWALYELEPYDPENFDPYALDLIGQDEERAEAYTAWDAYAEHMAREDGLETIGTWGANLHGIGLAKPGAARLAEYWTHGEGAAKIGWGTHDSMKRCIAELSKYVHKSPGGLCADYHKIATGEWPTEHGKAGIPS
jgi:hypothetical protein